MCKGKLDIQYDFERSLIWRFKLRLQHTGWLQYVPPFVLGGLFLAASRGIASCFPASAADLAAWSATVARLLWMAGVFDVVTIKLNVRPPEPLPERLDASDEKRDTCYAMRQRHSCRSFQLRKLTDGDRAEEIVRIANIESKRTIGTSPIRFEYVDGPLKVWPAVNAREFLVAMSPSKYDRMAMIDVGRSLQAVVLHATLMGLGTCWIGPGADHESILAALEPTGRYDGDKDHVVCVCAIGYKSTLVPISLRFTRLVGRKPCSELFFADRDFQIPLDITKPPFDEYEKCYEAARWSPSSFNAQPTICRGTWDRATDEVRFDFYSSTKSRYYAPVAAGIWLCDWEAACRCIGVRGRFAVLTNGERGTEMLDSSCLSPVYDISWTRLPADAK